MTDNQTGEATPRKLLRLWPGVLGAVLLLTARFGVPALIPEAMAFGMLGAIVIGLAILLWWLLFSRAAWSERVGVIVLMAVAMFATSRVVHQSIANAGMGMLLPLYGAQVLSVALVVWALATRRLSNTIRRVSIVAIVLLICAAFTVVRTGGITGEGSSDWHWRWVRTPEERLLTEGADEPALVPAVAAAPEDAAEASKSSTGGADSSPESSPAPAPNAAATTDKTSPANAADTRANWPGFRGPNRDGIVRGVQIVTDWAKSPPVQMWRHKVGPGWSSFAVRGDLAYTQEQRGEDEIVSCYSVPTGKPVWRHRDPARFWESNAGAGPRATPTLSRGRVYTFGATGILNALDARNGAVVWSRNAASDTGTKTPGWGFASSPLVVNDLVIVAASGRLAAYDSATGNPRWMAPARGGSYSSPHLMSIGGVQQVLLLSSTGVTSVSPADGAVLWEYGWTGVPILQPARTAEGDLLITTGDMAGGVGTRRIAVAHGSGGWTVDERWTSTGLKPYYNDFVVHKGYAYGFDGGILACIDLKDGNRKWKGGRYGHGQLVLLPDQDLLLVLSEEGELALVSATPEQFGEVAKFPALEGKTWNHPVLVGDVLLVRNGEEMAAFRLPLASR
ncbi:MAG TPA: PQQ-binding-like beta-propeller repeat protein [Blastocatellia bacterium]|nr:PQQ-binding-like beta-propeller repeat protein [Blastocatellia bacterium]